MQAICPKCATPLPYLEPTDGQFTCSCGGVISYKAGIYLFVDKDDFYEGRFTSTIGAKGSKKLLKNALNLFSIDGNEDRFYRRAISIIRRELGNKSLEILNIGAGGGHMFLKELGPVTSVDISLASLVSARNVSTVCYQADCTCLPFDANSFDLVFTSHVLGHLQPVLKNRAIAEMLRVLKPGGFSLHSIECEADNIIYRKAKRYDEFYRKAFVDMYGHIGLELPSINKQRFRSAGFEPVFEISDINKGVVRPIDSYKIFFGDKEFRKKELLFNVLYHLSSLLSSNPFIRKLSNILIQPISVLNKLAGEDGADSVKLLYRKQH